MQHVDLGVRVHEDDVFRAAVVDIVDDGRDIEQLVLQSVGPSWRDAPVRVYDIQVLPERAHDDLLLSTPKSTKHHCFRF